MDRVAGKVAMVTGAGSGIGEAVAGLLAREGARVAATDINADAGRKAVEGIKTAGGEAVFFKHDVTRESDWEAVTAGTLRQYGRLDVLVNCAGIFLATSVQDTTLEKWRWLMSINLDGTFLGVKYGAEAMKKNGGGSIINLSSAGGIVGTANSIAYNASKGGVRLLTKAAAFEFSRAVYNYNIRVNSVHPGVIPTPMTNPLISDPAGGKDMLSWTPMGHFGDREDVAYGVLYLASDESKFVTGAELVIDGGWTAH
jgi:3(or 17)beta-hydroxysteroid dehydrogenase